MRPGTQQAKACDEARIFKRHKAPYAANKLSERRKGNVQEQGEINRKPAKKKERARGGGRGDQGHETNVSRLFPLLRLTKLSCVKGIGLSGPESRRQKIQRRILKNSTQSSCKGVVEV